MNAQAYRRFNIVGVTPGDDYAAMTQALTRRYSAMEADVLPDVLLMDGGEGQVNAALQVLAALNIHTVLVMGIAKGTTRKAGLETLILQGSARYLPPQSDALHLLQKIRDEAHRFAITGHRKKRAKASGHSRLEDIEGVGAVRRRALLTHFGGWQGVSRASVEELNKVPGIHLTLAERIYEALHESQK